MPRNSAGVYSLPEAPFVSNTPISSSATNSNNSDIADAVTDSLSRNGRGGMNALLGLALSGFNYTSDPDTGMSRSAANTQVITVGGSNWTFTTTDVTAPSGTSLLPLIGEVRIWVFATAPTGWVLLQGQACTTTYPLWRAALLTAGNPFGTSGSDPLFPDLRGAVPAGVDAGRGVLMGATLGAFLGAQSVTLDATQIPAHTHAVNIVSGDAGYTVGASAPLSPGAPEASGTGGVFTPIVAGGSTALNPGTHAHNVIGNTGVGTGGGQAHANVQPTIALNFIGRAA